MKNRLYTVARITLVVALIYFAYRHLPSNKTTFDQKQMEQEDDPAAAIRQEFEKTKDPATGDVPTERLLIARQFQRKQLARQRTSGAPTILNAVPGIDWTERGPGNIGGRTRAILYDANDPTHKKVWAGGVGGGLWYCNDISAATPVWNKVNDLFDNLAVTCIHQQRDTPQNLYFGTGEGWYPGEGIFGIRGLGIWRSVDGGATWTHLASTIPTPADRRFYYIQDIAVVCCAVTGNPPVAVEAILVATKYGGIQRSIDGGATWTKVLGNGVGGGSVDQAADLDPIYSYVFASMGISSSDGIYRTADGGSTWVKIYQSAGDEQRIKIASAPNAYWQMWALIQSSGNGIKKIMKTSNADDLPGNTVWSDKPNPTWCDNGTTSADFTRGQAWYDLAAAIDPWDTNTVYIGGVDVFKTVTGATGATPWTQITQWKNGCPGYPYVHADIQKILIAPGSSFPGPAPEFLVACDGGIFRTADIGASFSSRDNSYNVTQYYACAVHPSSTNYFLAGGQDNGTQQFTSPGINSPATLSPPTTVSGGDGGFCHIDQNVPNTQITAYAYNNYNVTTDGAASFIAYHFAGGAFINPTDYDNASRILYGNSAAGQYFRWQPPFTYATFTTMAVAGFGGANITHVKVSPITPNRVYFGLDNGSIVRVDSANGMAPAVTIIKAVGAGSVSCVAIDPRTESHLLATYSNYGVSHVFETIDAGAHWTDVTGDLPDMPVRWAIFDPRNAAWAIIATELGVWSTDNLHAGAVDWQPTNTDFVNTRVDMLKYRPADGTLAAATHGRGLFTTVIPGVPTPIILVDFSGRWQGNEVELTWETAQEQNTKGFDIERSPDGLRFSKVGYVAAAGNSSIARDYYFNDTHFVPGKNYYRLKLIDRDGSTLYSKIILVGAPAANQPLYSVLNNPFDNGLDLQFGAIPGGKGDIRLVDFSGRTLLKWSGTLTAGSRVHISVSDLRLSRGVYTLQLFIQGTRYVTTVMKE
ncbi:hypothetical protein [Puia dinghuensis]|uniref:T9SS C-terminal target domain-containing protein n=1 Tax=Puia dinghuensis TaxID=1792502 RepID=A0A8J2XRC5_9BACT|nr:hypothetical protein [Puia dinghuensis]GGB00198.1 hypothetical protein GCM10011511_24410 [Puia dinghuensis]